MTAVLYIDDDVGNLTVLEAAFGDDFEILTADSGRAGLELLGGREVGVLLCDQRMPGMTGVDVLEKARTIAPDTVRILITAYSDLGEAMFVDLGGLRAFKGSQRYAIPAGVDLKNFQSVIIWCRQFSVLISPADLTMK